MFTGGNVFVTIDDFKARVKDKREQDSNHIVEIGLSLPLTHEIAEGILPEMARDLFVKAAGEMVPRKEVRDITFDIKTGKYIAEIRGHVEADADLRILGTTIRRVAASKTEAGAWSLSFVVSWLLGVDDELSFFVRRLASGVYLTLIEMEPDMLGEADKARHDPAPGDGADVRVNGSGVVEDISTGRRRGRRAAAKPAPEGDGAVDPSASAD